MFMHLSPADDSAIMNPWQWTERGELRRGSFGPTLIPHCDKVLHYGGQLHIAKYQPSRKPSGGAFQSALYQYHDEPVTAAKYLVTCI